MSTLKDRAASVTPTVLQTVYSSSSPTVAHERVEALLREEFADEKRQAAADRDLNDDV